MKQNGKYSGRAASLPGALGIGVSASVIITALSAVIMAHMLEREQITWETAGYGIAAMLIVSSYIGALVSWMRTKRQRFAVCILSGTLYYSILLSITALFFGGQYEGAGVTLALVAAGCGSVGLGDRDITKRKKKFIRYGV